ncbi:hypothetical protein JDV02_007345 [Purpureocillium takamizusanense]|uniref:Phytocyanin domain-containing protein n=1 Tax=Purpureocillium takamizusanense TaxID=2060973 RepID=A0A9Q8VDY7_9HYPO|nr:uncharacterized protein JDV02_007345 [Purpureocillium takamizusanense]UNI21349.1 hypothetical protein JDV02_007345 [Purpureocillium takamizusanense]
MYPLGITKAPGLTSFLLLLLLFSASFSSTAAKVIVINVGQGGRFAFSPDNIKAAPGDHVEFHFFGEHTAVSAAFSKPCSPASTSGGGGFFSGDMKNKGIFTITVNNTDPTFFYCAIDGHCQAGMVGVINEGPVDKLPAFKSAAAKTDSSSAPTAAGPYGGTNGPAPNSGGSSSSSSSASSASTSAAAGQTTTKATTSGTGSGTSAASPTTTSSSGSQHGGAGQQLTGAVAGVGGLALVVAALVAA